MKEQFVVSSEEFGNLVLNTNPRAQIMSKKKRLTTGTQRRRSQRLKKQAQKTESFSKKMGSEMDSAAEDDEMSTVNNHCLHTTATENGVSEEDSTLKMLNAMFELHSEFDINTVCDSAGCSNTWKEISQQDQSTDSCSTQTLIATYRDEILQPTVTENCLKEREDEIAILRKEKEEMSLLIEKLSRDLERNEMMVFKKDEITRKQAERIRQLEDTNSYRKVVVELEAEAEKQESARRRLQSELDRNESRVKTMDGNMEKQMKDLQELTLKYEEVVVQLQKSEDQRRTCEESSSYFMTENKKLKNKLKTFQQDQDQVVGEEENEEVMDAEENNTGEKLKTLKEDFEKFQRFICEKVDRLTDMYGYQESDTSATENEFENYITGRTQTSTSSLPSPKADQSQVVSAVTPFPSTHATPHVVTIDTPLPSALETAQHQHSSNHISQKKDTLQGPLQEPIYPSQQSVQPVQRRQQPTEETNSNFVPSQQNPLNVNRVLSTLSNTVHPSGTAYIPSKKHTSLPNSFSNLQYVNNSSYSQVQKDLPIRPGNKLYSNVVSNRKAAVFSTSMTRDFNIAKFRRDCQGEVNLHKFHGKKARHFKTYVRAHLPEEKPDVVLIQAGGNDLPTKSTVLEIANDIIEAGIVCKQMGASKVLISSVLPRRDFHLQLKRHDLNNVLKSLCEVNNFTFIPNSKMVLSQHISNDALVHLCT